MTIGLSKLTKMLNFPTSATFTGVLCASAEALFIVALFGVAGRLTWCVIAVAAALLAAMCATVFL